MTIKFRLTLSLIQTFKILRLFKEKLKNFNMIFSKSTIKLTKLAQLSMIKNTESHFLEHKELLIQASLEIFRNSLSILKWNSKNF